MSKKITILLFGLIALLQVQLAYSRSLQEIKRSGKIYVGFTESDYININYQLAYEFARYLNVKLIEVKISWEDAFSQKGKIPGDIETNTTISYTPDVFKEVDIICSTFSVLEWRKRLFDFAETLYSAELLLVNNKAEVPRGFSGLKGKTIAFEAGTSFESHMQRINEEVGGGIILKPLKEDLQVKRNLLDNKVYGIILDADEALKFRTQHNKQYKIAFPISKVSKTAWAVEKGNTLRAEVESFFETISSNGVLDDIFYKQFDEKYSAFVDKVKSNARLQVYKRDLPEILKSKKLVVALRDRNFIYHVGGQKQFMQALAEEFADYLGVQIEFVITPYFSKYWENDAGLVVKDSIYTPDWFNYFDLACEMISPNNWREQKVSLIPVYTSEYSIVARKQTPIHNTDDLKKYKGITDKGTVYQEMLTNFGVTSFYESKVDNFLQDIENGSGDYAIMYNAFFEISEYPNLEVKLNLGKRDVCWATKKTSPRLQKEIEKFISQSKEKGLINMLIKAQRDRSVQSNEDILSNYYERFQKGLLPSVVYGVEDGLPQEDINAIFQDKKGYMWFGTNGGLVRYNGRNMKIFGTYNGLPDNQVFDIRQDTTGKIYVATSKGVAQIISDSLIRPIIKEVDCKKIFIDKKNNKWILSSESLILLDNKGRKTDFSTKIISGSLNDICEDRQGNVILASNDGVFVIDLQKQVKKVSILDAYAIYADLNDSVWISTKDGLMIIGAGKLLQQKKPQLINKELGLPFTLIKKIVPNRYGYLWLITDSKIYQVISAQQKSNVYEKEIGLKNNTILSLLEDGEDNLWIGFSGGLQKLSNRMGLRNFYPTTLNSYIYNIFEDILGRTWIASNNGIYYSKQTLVNFTSELPLKHEKCVAGLLPNKNILIANSDGIYEVDVNNLKIVRENKYKQFIVSLENVFISEKGEIFLLSGIKGIIYYYKSFNAKPIAIQNKSTSNVLQLDDCNGRIIGGNSTGLIEFDGKTFNPLLNLDNAVWSVCYDDEQLWVGTDKGLGTYEKGRFNPISINLRQETSIVIKSILPAKNKNYLWLGTNSGFMYFNKATRQIELTVDSRDGLLGDEITVNGLYVDSNDILWIGTYHGVSNFNLKAKTNHSYAPVCYIEKIYMNDHEISKQDGIKFKYNENNLVFEISALSFTDESSIEYEFYLRGLGNNYLSYNNGKEYKAYYSNLPPGDYEFIYKAKGKNNIWGYARSFHFTISKAWYQTWMFRILICLIGIAIIFFLYKWRVHRIEMQNQKLEQLVKQRTVELENANVEIEAQRDMAQNQCEQIAAQKKEITDSIFYAERIQQSVLPSVAYLNELLPEHFIIFQPRDIVSGDFYWAVKKVNTVYVAAADCTGHGVPGAIMSMLGIAFLNQIMSKTEVLNPAEVLNELRRLVVKALHQRGIQGEAKDGMDIALCAIDFEAKKLQFAGANNPLYHYRKGNLVEIKGDKMPVAIHERMDSFTNHEIELESDDLLYFFSDGYADQFGGPEGKKFMCKSLKNSINEVWEKSMAEQKEFFIKQHIAWKGEFEQIDDIVLIGVKI
jgi:ligand-binding sensor domain-containing protein/serine phosphatase RsbU (regulator of sigma subunit)/ABC-type amino acid transport substrate-binding protein